MSRAQHPQEAFTPQEVVEIRAQYAARVLDVRVWADLKRCGLETVRRVARGDTYRHVDSAATHPSFGGLRAASLAPLDEEVNEATMAASFARLQASLAAPSSEAAQSALATALLDELQGAAGFAKSSADGDAELS